MASAPASAITIKYCCQSGKGEGRCVCVWEGGGAATAKGQAVSFGQGDGGWGGMFSNHKTSLVTKGLAVQKIILFWTMPGHSETWTFDAF